MVKILVASYNRASDGAISKLVQKMKDENMYTDEYKKADYVLAVGDRSEVFDISLMAYRDNKKIIHLWAGEANTWETHDDVYRHAITLMSHIQLCTNDEAKERVKKLCKAVGKVFFVITVGNIMLDNMNDIDESLVPNNDYDIVLYNPPTRLEESEVIDEMNEIFKKINKHTIWLEPNGDKYSNMIRGMVFDKTLDKSEPTKIGWQLTMPRYQFLGLMKNCKRFITNSSCMYYEAPFICNGEVVPIGRRNKRRESKIGNMTIKGASDKIMKLFRGLQ